jgi:hypothetical protein
MIAGAFLTPFGMLPKAPRDTSLVARDSLPRMFSPKPLARNQGGATHVQAVGCPLPFGREANADVLVEACN